MNLRVTLAAVVLLLLAHVSYAQFPGAKGPKRYEIGYSFCVSAATYHYDASVFNESTGILQDTSFNQHITTKGGFGATAGYTWPVSRLSDKSCIAIALAFNYNFLLWESGEFSYSYNSQTGSEGVGSGSVEMGLPVGVDYKFGCDALGDKSQRFCYTLGAGIYPAYSLTVYKDAAALRLRTLPYLKGEVGVFAGICFKIRAMYSFGNIKYIDYKDNSDYHSTSLSLKGKSSLTLSLIFMPFSWKFSKSKWW